MIHHHYKKIIQLAFPVILANASVPLLGLADTAMIGQTGLAADLGAIALATLVFSFVYWAFGFLRMGTTGFIAQASSKQNKEELHALLFRSILLGLIIGLVLIICQKLIGQTAMFLLGGSQEIKLLVADYFYIRIWGAPATLITFSLLGAFIGMGWTRQLLWTQLFLNGLNILLNVLFVVKFDMGVKGIALGTVCAEWACLIFAFYLILKKFVISHPIARIKTLWTAIINKRKITALMKVNSDIMIRTLALISGFAWFANQGAKFGDHTLASNHVLLQFVSLSAFFLDGFAHVVEMLAGRAYGAKNKTLFTREVKQSTILAALCSVFLSVLIYGLADQLIPLLSKDAQIQGLASDHVLYAAIYILISFAAFQLDGIFIGVTRSTEMRNATLISLAIFLAAAIPLSSYYSNAGLWLAFILFVLVRAISLGLYYPRILKHMD